MPFAFQSHYRASSAKTRTALCGNWGYDIMGFIITGTLASSEMPPLLEGRQSFTGGSLAWTKKPKTQSGRESPQLTLWVTSPRNKTLHAKGGGRFQVQYSSSSRPWPEISGLLESHTAQEIHSCEFQLNLLSTLGRDTWQDNFILYHKWK